MLSNKFLINHWLLLNGRPSSRVWHDLSFYQLVCRRSVVVCNACIVAKTYVKKSRDGYVRQGDNEFL